MKACEKRVRRLIRRLRGSTMPHKINKRFAYARMVQLCSMARKAEEKASWLQGDVKKQALENAKYLKELADEISELI